MLNSWRLTPGTRLATQAPVSASVVLPRVNRPVRSGQRETSTSTACPPSFTHPQIPKGSHHVECRAVAEKGASTSEAELLQRDVLQDPVPRGDTAGAVLLLQEVTIQAGDRDLLQVRNLLTLDALAGDF